jgi:hypothetical protein
MDEKPIERRPRVGVLFWMSLVVLALVGGFVAGWQSSIRSLRDERDDLQFQVERQTGRLRYLERQIDQRERRLKKISSNIELATRISDSLAHKLLLDEREPVRSAEGEAE